jgi:hypothetical protein
VASRQNLKVNVGATELNVVLYRSGRKSLALIVHPDMRIECRFPLACSMNTVEEFINSKTRWLQKTLRKIAARPKQTNRTFQEASLQPFLGVEYGLKLMTRATVNVQLSDLELILSCRKPDSPASVSRVLRNWYREQAKRVFAERLIDCQKLFPGKQACSGLIIRRMKSRWGSCSSTGVITLNSRLVEYPSGVIDYVIVHELCHLVHFSHNKQFYRLLTEKMPDWLERRAVLSGY